MRHPDPLAEGMQALAEARWDAARTAFEAALAAQPECAEALEGLGMAAWWADDAPAVFGARERAYRAYRARDDRLGAARVAIAIAEDYRYFRGESAVSHGWHLRARRLLEQLPPTAEHGWLQLSEADFALFVQGDAARAAALAASAAALGREVGVVDLEMVALALEGLALVAQGGLGEGMDRLDEAVAAALSGEMTDHLAIGYCCCYLVSACERVRDFERAAQWVERVSEYSARIRFNTLFAVCRAQRASVLVWRGEWEQAESELGSTVLQLSEIRPAMRTEGVVRLAELRRLQGRYPEARALLRDAETHPLAAAALAAVALDQGRTGEATGLAEAFLRRTPAENLAERLAGLDVLLRAHVASGDLPRAGEVLRELEAAARAIATQPVLAMAHFARGLVHAALGEHPAARVAFDDAAVLFARSGGRYDCARSRVELARSLAALGDASAARDALSLAVEAFRSLAAQADLRRAELLLRELGSRSAAGPAERLSPRELAVLGLVAQGLSNQEIARRLFISEHTVKRHVANILTKLGLPTRAAASAHAVRAGLV